MRYLPLLLCLLLPLACARIPRRARFTPPAPEVNAESIRGEVRVRLLECSEQIRYVPDPGGGPRAKLVRGLGILYVAEALAPGEPRNWNIQQSQLLGGGGRSLEVPVTGDEASSGPLLNFHGYTGYPFHLLALPKVAIPEQACVIDEWFPGTPLPEGPFTLRIWISSGPRDRQLHSFTIQPPRPRSRTFL